MASILVVEDELVSQKIIQSILEKKSHTVQMSRTVAEALDQLEKHTLIDLVVLDNVLQGEYGWDFLRRVRKDFVFQHIPVIVYSASSDRNSVLRYLQLGVQKILVKPYNVKDLQEEIERALKQDWRSMIFEPIDRVCQRLNINEDEYYKALIAAAKEVVGHVNNLNRTIVNPHGREFANHISALNSSALNLGVSILENAAELINETAEEGKLEQSIYYINRLIPTARLMHHRALNHFGMTSEESDFPGDVFATKPVMEKKTTRPPLESAYHNQRARDQLQYMLEGPFYSYAPALAPLATKGILEREETLEALTRDEPGRALQTYRETLADVLDITDAEQKNLCRRISAVKGLEERIIGIAQVSKESSARPMSLPEAVEHLGLIPSSGILAVTQWMAKAREAQNPLQLVTLAEYTLGTAMLSREISLRFKDVKGFFTASLLHQTGKWALALQYPAYYGLALAMAQNDPEKLLEVETQLFGLNHQEVAEALLKAWDLPAELSATASYYDFPANAPHGKARLYCGIVNLAGVLVRYHRIGYNGRLPEDEESRFIEAPGWDALKAEAVEVPLDPSDYFSAFAMTLERLKRQLHILFS